MSTKYLLRPCLAACAVAAVCLVLPSSKAQAALLAYEPFEYGDVAVPAEGQYMVGDENAGTGLLGGQNPVIGPTAFYSGPWVQAGGDSQVVKAVPSLTYPKFQAGIGGIQGETVQFDCCTFGRTGREISGGLGVGRDARTIYQSFLIDFGTQGTDAATDFGKRGHELWNGYNPDNPDSTLAVDLFVNHFAGVNELSLGVHTLSESTTVPLSGGGHTLESLAGFNGGTHLVVMKYEFNPTDPDVVTVYLDPKIPTEPVHVSAQVVIEASDLFITHDGAFTNFTFSGGGHVPGAIDEIRWGETYEDVNLLSGVIPEPATLSLVGFALLGGLLTRKR